MNELMQQRMPKSARNGSKLLAEWRKQCPNTSKAFRHEMVHLQIRGENEHEAKLSKIKRENRKREILENRRAAQAELESA